MKENHISWGYIDATINEFAIKVMREKIPFDVVVAISRGGITPGVLFKKLMDSYTSIPVEFKVVDPFVEGSLKEFAGKNVILIDDIYDTGATTEFFIKEANKYKVNITQFFIIVKEETNIWYKFPWETSGDEAGGKEQAVLAILRGIGEDPLREGLKDTPKRVSRMWDELTVGYKQDPSAVLGTDFSAESYDEMIILRDIEFFSTCEHHLLPFYGKVHFGYLPDKRLVGISKVARLVECFSHRLQIQEKMTWQLGKAFEEVIKPKGVAVVVEGVHLCMMLRGVRKRNAVMTTSYLSGAFREKIEAREEFLRLIKK